jgi:Activator of Hsp90 ATPase homolog 1-like protein
MNHEDKAAQGKALNRRQAIVCAAGAIGGIALWSTQVRVSGEEEISHSEEAIHQVNGFKASRKRVYDALTQWSPEMQAGKSLGSVPTKISPEVGGEFFLFGGHIIGRHLELVPNERIVQAWRVVDWEPGLYSIARFQLSDEGAGTKIVFDHTGFPKGQAEHLAFGWKAHYWDGLTKYLA